MIEYTTVSDMEYKKILDTSEVLFDNGDIYEYNLKKIDSNNVSFTYKMQLLKNSEQTLYYLFIDRSFDGQSLESCNSDIEVAKRKFFSIFHDLTGNYWHLREHFVNVPDHYEYVHPNELNSSSSSEEQQVGLNQINNVPKFHGGERVFFNIESNTIERTFTYVNNGYEWKLFLPKIRQESSIIKSLLNVRKAILRIGILYERKSTTRMFFGTGCLLSEELILTCAHYFDVIQWGDEKVPYCKIYVCLCDPAPEAFFSLSNRNESIIEANLIRRGLLHENLSEYDEIHSNMLDLGILKLNKSIKNLVNQNEFLKPTFNTSPLPINSKLFLVSYNGELVEDSDVKRYKNVHGLNDIPPNQFNFSHNANYKSVSVGVVHSNEPTHQNIYSTHSCSTLPGSSGGVIFDDDGNFAGIHIGVVNSRQSKNGEMFFNNDTYNKYISVKSKPFYDFINESILSNINDNEIAKHWRTDLLNFPMKENSNENKIINNEQKLT